MNANSPVVLSFLLTTLLLWGAGYFFAKAFGCGGAYSARSKKIVSTVFKKLSWQFWVGVAFGLILRS
ncbi:MAG: hypothetical protein WC250_01130 [Candidatus Paceibacterota bacterium]|jgi:hypothetical protein